MRLIAFFGLALALAAGACTSNDPMGDDEAVNCAEETRDDDFVVGLQKSGQNGAINFTLMTATPAPPLRGDNTWVVQLNSMSGGVVGAPITGAAMTVTPYMPDHGHPSGKTVLIEAMPEAGQYQLAPINFHMPSLWETTLDVTSPGGNDNVVFRFCIPS